MQINIFDIKNHRNPLVETEKICSNILRHLEKKFKCIFQAFLKNSWYVQDKFKGLWHFLKGFQVILVLWHLQNYSGGFWQYTKLNDLYYISNPWQIFQGFQQCLKDFEQFSKICTRFRTIVKAHWQFKTKIAKLRTLAKASSNFSNVFISILECFGIYNMILIVSGNMKNFWKGYYT